MIPPRNEIVVLHPLTHEQSVDVVERVMRVFEDRAAARSSGGFAWCSNRALQRGLDIEFGLTDGPEEDRPVKAPRFPRVYCSQCGQEFGPGNEGFSSCQDHREALQARKKG